jgi:hypothetical protein
VHFERSAYAREVATVRGVLIGESLRLDSSLRNVSLRVSAVTRFRAPDEPAGGPPWWTFIEFEADGSEADHLSAKLAACLDDALPWYASFKSDTEMFVIFASRRFCYSLGDLAQKAEVEAYARNLGVPESQLDWEL